MTPSKKSNQTRIPVQEPTDEALKPDQVPAEGHPSEPTLESLQEELAEAKQARLRALADFSNFQRRATENEDRSRKAAQIEVIRQVLPALDQLNLALEHSDEDASMAQLRQGVELAQAEFIKALTSIGVEIVDPQVGDEFDPHLHQAVMREPSDEFEPNHVIRVLQVGQEFGGQVIRPAQVIVSAPVES